MHLFCTTFIFFAEGAETTKQQINSAYLFLSGLGVLLPSNTTMTASLFVILSTAVLIQI
ncbi:hypothetical protein HMPREF2738_02584 [Clostridiales bacterium KLE1615]|nr:hypothetical protein HMPREF2738_02584 [Clostridiales bacterium KLE1615]